MKQLEVKNLSFSYDEATHAVRHVSFAIEKGSYTTIIGHNGSGKSTIAKLLIGLLEKDEGEILIDNLPLNEENLMEIRSRVGIVLQNPITSSSVPRCGTISHLVWKTIAWRRKKWTPSLRNSQKRSI